MVARLKRRKWVYLQPPSTYSIAPCECGNVDTEWSEYQKHLWCAKCLIDFIPKHNGIFDGPIPVKVCQMMGITFDRINLKTKKVDKFVIPE